MDTKGISKDLKNKKWCIYKHTNKINGKVYIGTTSNPQVRFRSNCSEYLHKYKGTNNYTQPYFAHAILKYGWKNFKHEILEENLTYEQANILEKEYIEKYDSTNPDRGYNIANGGFVKNLSEETKKKISEANKKYYENHEHHRKGIHKTEEQKEHMRKIMTGRQFTDEWKENIGKAHAPFVYICVETGKEYYSSGEAMRDTGIDKASIRRAADGQQKTAGGLHWIKKEKEINP